MESDEGIEALSTNPALFVQYRGNMREKAYAQLAETSSVRTYGGAYAGRGERYDFNPKKLILGSRYNVYWIERKGKKAFKNVKQFLKLYPKH